MNNVIAIKSPKEWADATLLKRSIAWMKARNEKGRFDKAIFDEEELLRSFFDGIRGRSTPADLSQAA